ncbi:hypothetical protein DI392_10945 [Vibrio albus]|uniref:Diguanylate cyclase n=1 Tax=Vibrio albus TaxID=2200953 RepID=A0A2U3B9H4_9VIBR|nr:diguanylate cyclase [Vibrio albus]PWI33364.1 hypothetical protein DI392_10945 [Vibrio albus]
MRLNSKVSLTIIPLVTIPLLLVGVYSYYLLWHRNMDTSHAQLEYYIEHLEMHYRDGITETAIALKTLSEDSLLRQYLLTKDESDRYMLMHKPMLAKLHAVQNTNPKLREISLLLPNGYEDLWVSNRNAVNYTEDESGSLFFREIQQQKTAFHTYLGINPDTEKNTFYVSVPIIFRDRTQDTFTTAPKTRGYLAASIDPTDLLFHNIPSPWDQGTTLLTRSNQIYQPYPGEKQILNSDNLIKQLKTLPVNQWTSTTIDDQRVQHFSTKLAQDLIFHAYIPENVLLASSLSINSFILALAALMLLISIPLMLKLFRNYILTPIETINQAVYQLRTGEEIVEIPKTTSDELNELASAYTYFSHELYRSNQRIHNLAYIDSLTGLPNRTLFQRNLMRAIQYADHEHEILALLYVDLDNFKSVNDNMNHATGDLLLQTIANILRELLRTEDMATRIEYDEAENDQQNNERSNCSRLGGDEFTILLPHLRAPYQAALVAERIMEAINRPIPINEHTVYVTASIGIALW